MKKTLLLDIDYTLFEGDVPRPYLKEFIEYVSAKYNIHFYTAGTFMRVTEVCRHLRHKMGFDPEFVRNLQRSSLTSENCKTIEIDGATIKCLKKAADVLKVPIGDIIMLDDNPKYDNPHESQIIEAEGFMADYADTDDYLLRVMNQNIL
jgi:TFIIF-interacting CTD phosphatase-like protein